MTRNQADVGAWTLCWLLALLPVRGQWALRMPFCLLFMSQFCFGLFVCLLFDYFETGLAVALAGQKLAV